MNLMTVTRWPRAGCLPFLALSCEPTWVPHALKVSLRVLVYKSHSLHKQRRSGGDGDTGIDFSVGPDLVWGFHYKDTLVGLCWLELSKPKLNQAVHVYWGLMDHMTGLYHEL